MGSSTYRAGLAIGDADSEVLLYALEERTDVRVYADSDTAGATAVRVDFAAAM